MRTIFEVFFDYFYLEVRVANFVISEIYCLTSLVPKVFFDYFYLVVRVTNFVISEIYYLTSLVSVYYKGLYKKAMLKNFG